MQNSCGIVQVITDQNNGNQFNGDTQSHGINPANTQNAKLTSNDFINDDAECDKINVNAIAATGTTETAANFTTTGTPRKDDKLASANSNHHTLVACANTPFVSNSVTVNNPHTIYALKNCTAPSTMAKETKDNSPIVNPARPPKPARKDEPADVAPPRRPQFYNKPTYVVLIGDNLRVVNTKVYSSLPLQSKYMVKERITGTNKVKLVLKSRFVYIYV